MNQADMLSDGEFATVVAAAAYAITKLEEKESRQKRRKSVEFSEASLPKSKYKNEETKIKLNSFRGSFKRLFGGQDIEEDTMPRGQNRRPESVKEKKPSLKTSMTTKFPTSSRDTYQEDPSKAKAKADAEAWEKAQMIKINIRYEKMLYTIIKWENKKKEEGRIRLEKKKNEPESVRARAMQKYKDEMSSIEKVSGEAKAAAEDGRREDEKKAHSKAAKIRVTGKLPHSRRCCCC